MPSLTTDAEAEAFVDKADLSQFDLTQFQPMQFEFERKSNSFGNPLLCGVSQKQRLSG
jgi:predicted DNA binding CopG/RHH family protein